MSMIRPGVRELMHHDPVRRELVTAALTERVHTLRKALQKKHAWAETAVSEENLKRRRQSSRYCTLRGRLKEGSS